MGPGLQVLKAVLLDLQDFPGIFRILAGSSGKHQVPGINQKFLVNHSKNKKHKPWNFLKIISLILFFYVN